MQLKDTVKKWIFFFHVLDANGNGILEPDDIEIIVDRLINSKPNYFSKGQSSYIRMVTLKNFDRLLMEAKSEKGRKISLLDWVRMIKKSNDEHNSLTLSVGFRLLLCGFFLTSATITKMDTSILMNLNRYIVSWD